MITDDYILARLREAKPRLPRLYAPEFSLDDLVGKTVIEYMKIPYQILRNPDPKDHEDPQNAYRFPPKFFSVLVFSDQTFFATEMRADGECTHLLCYFFNGKKTLSSDCLFGLSSDCLFG